MSRYFSAPRKRLGFPTIPRATYDDWNPLLPSLSVDDHVAVDTGLVDQRGDPIMRAPNPIGFHRP